MVRYWIVVSALLLPAALRADVKVIEQIIAKINNEIITRSEIERSRWMMAEELKQRGTSAEAAEKLIQEREKDFLRDRIDQMLLVQKARELSINVDAEVSKYLAELQERQKIADSDKFHAWVREQTGMVFEDFKAELRNNMLTQRVIRQEVGSRITVPRAEIQKFYEDNKEKFFREERVFLREILLSTRDKEPAQIAAIEKKAKDLVARARKGEKFHELARDHSDADTAQQGGALDPFKRGELLKQLDDVVWSQERGWVSDPIRIPNGFLIVKLEEKHKAGQASLEEVEGEIMEQIYQPRMQPALREYLTKLRMEAFLEIRDGYVDSGAAPGKNTKWTDPAQLRPDTITKEEVAARTRRRRLLWAIPIPGTSTSVKKDSSSK